MSVRNNHRSIRQCHKILIGEDADLPPLAATGYRKQNHPKKDDLKESRNMNKEDLQQLVDNATQCLKAAIPFKKSNYDAAAFAYHYGRLEALADVAERSGYSDMAKNIDHILSATDERRICKGYL